jgi:tRNA pseudouridine-54 N-methylase
METTEVRILIDIRGGNLQAVLSNVNIKYVVVDHDNLSADQEQTLSEMGEAFPDRLVNDNDFHRLYSEEIAKRLKLIGW